MTARTPIPVRTLHFDSIDSTSLHARRLIESGAIASTPAPGEALALVARVQTGGVGRFGRGWSSPPGGLWMTLVIPQPREWAQTPPADLGVRIGVACHRAIAGLSESPPWSARVKLKWPNDILVDGKKVLGVLTELVLGRVSKHPNESAFLLVGIGVNVNVDLQSLPDALRRQATTLRQALDKDVDVPTLRASLIRSVVASMNADDAERKAAIDYARTHLAGLGTAQTWDVTMPDDTRRLGRLVRLCDDGTPEFDFSGELVQLPLGAAIMLP